jgi:hypothetical protein
VPGVLEDGSSVVLSAGSLEGDPGSRPVRHIFVRSKAPWFEICDELAQFEEHAPGSRARLTSALFERPDGSALSCERR